MFPLRCYPFYPPDFFLPMTDHRVNKRPRDEDSDPLESDDSDAFTADDNPQTKRYKPEPSQMDTVRSTAFKKLQKAPRGSMGIPAVRALLAKSGSLSKFGAASREANSGLRKAVCLF